MNPRPFLGGGWARGGSSDLVRRAHPASGAQWNVQVVRGKVNGKCLWNACKALSLGLLLMVLGAAMATIGYFADQLSVAQEVRGNHTVKVKNESRGFHLNNLSYAGPIVMGVGGFIVVAACVMTFEARDSAAKVVPARLKVSTSGPPSNFYNSHHGALTAHGSLRTSGSQTAGVSTHPHQHNHHSHGSNNRRALTQSFMHFSKGLAIEANVTKTSPLKIPQGSIKRSPSAPDLVLEENGTDKISPSSYHNNATGTVPPTTTEGTARVTSRRTFAAHALLNPGLLHRHALSVDESAANYRSNESLQHGIGSQGSMAMDLHLECPVTLKVRDKRRNPLKRQRKVEEDEKHNHEDSFRRSSHSCSPRITERYLRENGNGGSAYQLPTHSYHSRRRRSSNASDCSHRSTRSRKKECSHPRGKLERAISSDSRLTGAIPKCYHTRSHEPSRNNSTDQEVVGQTGGSSSDTDIRRQPVVTFSPRKSYYMPADD